MSDPDTGSAFLIAAIPGMLLVALGTLMLLWGTRRKRRFL